MQWFGEPWPSAERRAPICEDDALRVPVPVDQPCLWCHEPIDPASQGVMMAVMWINRSSYEPVHKECQFRQVMGGPAHLFGTCTCQGGNCDPDMGMTPREAAKTVWKAIQR